jgi:hypothetical protein
LTVPTLERGNGRKEADFSAKAPVKKLTLINGEIYSGNVLNNFVVSEPFKFLGTAK